MDCGYNGELSWLLITNRRGVPRSVRPPELLTLPYWLHIETTASLPVTDADPNITEMGTAARAGRVGSDPDTSREAIITRISCLTGELGVRHLWKSLWVDWKHTVEVKPAISLFPVRWLLVFRLLCTQSFTWRAYLVSSKPYFLWTEQTWPILEFNTADFDGTEV
jgi:hypothetical protein